MVAQTFQIFSPAQIECLRDGGRMIVPLTAAMPAMGATLGKGLVVALTKQNAADYAARVLAPVAVYSAVGLRDDAMNDRLGKAMMGGPMKWAAVKRLRRDEHAETTECWYDGKGFCLG